MARDVFVQKIFGAGLSVQYACVPNDYSVVLTTTHGTSCKQNIIQTPKFPP